MARPLRIEFEEAIYHLCARGNARQAIFHDEQDRNQFVELLNASANVLTQRQGSKGSELGAKSFNNAEMKI